MHIHIPVSYTHLDVYKRQAGVRESRRIDDEVTYTLLASGMNALNEGALVIALERFKFDAGGSGAAGKCKIDLGKGHPSVMVRLARSQKIQVRSMQDKQLGWSSAIFVS